MQRLAEIASWLMARSKSRSEQDDRDDDLSDKLINPVKPFRNPINRAKEWKSLLDEFGGTKKELAFRLACHRRGWFKR